MKKFLFAAALLTLAVPALWAQVSDSHTVTVTVQSLDAVDVAGNVALDIVFDPVTGNGFDEDQSAVLSWATNGLNKQITVLTNLPAALFPLSVEAETLNGGGTLVAGQIALNVAVAQQIVNSISQTTGDCVLHYRATALLTDVPNVEVHTVTYTISN